MKVRVPLRQVVETLIRPGVTHLVAISMDGKRLFERFTDGQIETWHEFEGPTVEKTKRRKVSVSKPR